MSTPADVITPTSFADAMADLPAGVAVITTRGPDGPMGLTVTSMGPFTAEPPSLMVSVSHGSRSCDPLLGCEQFGVHLLARDQEQVAMAFVRKDDDKFAGLSWAWDGDVPRLDGALAYLRCHRDTAFTHHDHTLLIGAIVAIDRIADQHAAPLLYHRRKFCWSLQDDGTSTGG
ncbi:flavin reductase [Patulibacter medicamentivorans]|uniref:Flavin reductase n=1 Tax=Patulibacter medicamentivorans TaxID=1097667 RepID=H0E5P4_9ACTN|nr:flavin reductase family protein [Patulibacter medicamentivorans]EHN11007.1 flavin reductase [Patulibacter medicamentivorans]